MLGPEIESVAERRAGNYTHGGISRRRRLLSVARPRSHRRHRNVAEPQRRVGEPTIATTPQRRYYRSIGSYLPLCAGFRTGSIGCGGCPGSDLVRSPGAELAQPLPQSGRDRRYRCRWLRRARRSVAVPLKRVRYPRSRALRSRIALRPSCSITLTTDTVHRFLSEQQLRAPLVSDRREGIRFRTIAAF